MPEWIQSIDDQTFDWFRDHHTQWLDYHVKNLTVLGSTTLLAVIGPVALGALLLCNQYKKALLFVVLVFGLFYATQGIKTAVERHRPPHAKAHSGSFPSGHSSRTMTVLGLLALCLRSPRQGGIRPVLFVYALLTALLLAVAVGLSRLYLGDHYLSDVIAGWLLGLLFIVVFCLADRLTRSET
jgi:undecaprenyl-diphosphatase